MKESLQTLTSKAPSTLPSNETKLYISSPPPTDDGPARRLYPHMRISHDAKPEGSSRSANQTAAVGLTPRFQSNLDDISQGFARIDQNDFKACRKFIGNEPGILHTSYADQLWMEAVHALVFNASLESSNAKLVLHSRNCVSRYVLLTQYAKSSERDKKTLLSRLATEDKDTTRLFYKRFDIAKSTAKDQAQERVQAQRAAASQQRSDLMRDPSPHQSKGKAVGSYPTHLSRHQPLPNQSKPVKSDSASFPAASPQYEPSSYLARDWQASSPSGPDAATLDLTTVESSTAQWAGQLDAQNFSSTQDKTFINVEDDDSSFEANSAYLRRLHLSDNAPQSRYGSSMGATSKRHQPAVAVGQHSLRSLEPQARDPTAAEQAGHTAFADPYPDPEYRQLRDIPEAQENFAGVPSEGVASGRPGPETAHSVQQPRRSNSVSREGSYHRPRSYSIQKKPGSAWSLADLDNLNFRGKDSNTRSLDPRFEVKHDKTFFIIGRVFLFVSHEPASDAIKAERAYRNSPDKQQCPFSPARLGTWTYTCVRRMVVVRQKPGFCWCIPILTYSGRGLAKPGLNKTEIDEHAVIHGAGSAPYLHEDEPSPLFDPIAVQLKHDQHLDPMSRLHFGKPFTVECNVMVREVGVITGTPLDKFRGYWDDIANNRKRANNLGPKGSVSNYENL